MLEKKTYQFKLKNRYKAIVSRFLLNSVFMVLVNDT